MSALTVDPDDYAAVENIARVQHVAYTGNVPPWDTLSAKSQMNRVTALQMALYAARDEVTQ